MFGKLVAVFFLLVFAFGAKAQARDPDFNRYIRRAVRTLSANYGALGYRPGSYFTHELDYRGTGDIHASGLRPATMCVAAVSEVIIEALHQYFVEIGDETVFDALPPRSWNGGTRLDIRPYIFMFDGLHSDGTASALNTFGIGKETTFAELRVGDFVNFNRTNGTGHAVVFMGFVDDRYRIRPKYGDEVVGFKYFSAQGKNAADHGLGFRYAFFHRSCENAPHQDCGCPKKHEGKLRDCGVIYKPNQSTLNTGYMLHPARWSTKKALNELGQRAFVEHMQRERLSADERVRITALPTTSAEYRAHWVHAEKFLKEETHPASAAPTTIFDGITTDDE